jgi:hypothetical protein
MIAHWITADMKWHQALLSFKPTEAAHAGDQLAAFVLDVLQEFNITDRATSITADNAGNNRTMVEKLNTGLDASGGSPLTRLPCLSHVIQLAQGALVAKLGCKPTNEQINRNFNTDVVLQERRRYDVRTPCQTMKQKAVKQHRSKTAPKKCPDSKPTVKPAPQVKQCAKGNVRLPGSTRKNGTRSAKCRVTFQSRVSRLGDISSKQQGQRGKGKADEAEDASDSESEVESVSGKESITEISLTLWKVRHVVMC